MKYEKILAKSQPEKTLQEHTQDCFDKLGMVLQWKAKLIEQVCAKYGLDKDLIIKRLFLTVAFHDVGKANEKFQDKVRKVAFEGQESHPLASLPFVYHYTQDAPLHIEDDLRFYPEALAVVSHHNKLYHGVYAEGHKNMKVIYAEASFFEHFFDFINEQARKMAIPTWQDLVFEPKILRTTVPYTLFYDDIFDQVSSLQKNEKVRDIFLLFKSILHYADWLASSEYHNYQYTTKESYQSLTEKMKQKEALFVDWADFQKKSAESKGHIFVQIPTGQGKTEASVLWAVNQNENQKIIFLLPTMVTTNKMYDRMKHFFELEEAVGLSHGTAQYVLRKNGDIEPEELRKHYLYNRTFFKPVTVATVDQLLYSFFNWGHWVMTGSASYNAKIIIDEIHIYDAYTFGILLKVIEYIKPYNTQFAIMSASLPEMLKEEVEKILPTYTLIKEPIFDEKQRHTTTTFEGFISEKINEMIADYRAGKKVLVVCNTIKQARDIFVCLNDLPADKKMLYHSQFILLDKVEKEKILDTIKDKKGGFIAVCTQIVEVSLDIDFDVLYTENAPIDAIIQRLGRVNRKGKIQERQPNMPFAKVVITRETEISHKVYKKLGNILAQTFDFLQAYEQHLQGNLCEKHFKEIVDAVYTKENVGKEYFQELNDAKKLVGKIWKDIVKNIYTLRGEQRELEAIATRNISNLTYECVLQKHHQIHNFADMYENKQFDKVKEFTLKIPIYIVKQFKAKPIAPEADIYLINLEYDAVQGVTYSEDTEVYFP